VGHRSPPAEDASSKPSLLRGGTSGYVRKASRLPTPSCIGTSAFSPSPAPLELNHPGEFVNIDDFYGYYPSFRQLHTIELYGLHISSNIPKRMEMFSLCQQSLLSLTLADVSFRWRSFITFIEYFPNLRNLVLRSISRIAVQIPPSFQTSACATLFLPTLL